jgi:4,5-dihydroxyphthalate decarboxylase
MPLRPLKTALVTRGYTRALTNGTVTPAGFAFEFEHVPAIITAFRRMVRGLDFDVCEMALTTYVCARAHGKRFTAIPVFPMRAFHHGAIVRNTTSGIERPTDLEGHSVGVNRGYTVTTGVWARGILQHQYGVDLNRITWVLSGDEHVTEWQRPRNVVPMGDGRPMEDRIVSGEIPAAINVQVESPHVQPLIPNPLEAAFDALRTHGLYPINHTVVVKDDVLDAHPDVAPALFEAFAEAKQQYMNRIDDPLLLRVKEVIGDPLPYGLESNRHMIETLVRYAFEQHIIPRPFAIEELFAANTHHLNA